MSNSFNWLKILVGCELTDEQVQTIPNPKVELTGHVTLKFVQVFGTLGTLVIGPLVGIARISTRSLQGVVRTSTKFGRYGVITGIVLGPAVTYGRMKSINADHDAFYDRAYRLRHNKNQVNVDRGFFVGTAAGAVLFPLVLKTCPIFGALFGMSTSFICAGIYNNKIAK